MKEGLFIGELARKGGVPVSTVRYYERNGLLEEPERRESGYREYADSAIERLRFIRQAQDLGFTLKQIRSLIMLQSNPDARSADVRHQAQASIAEIRAKIATLTAMEASMSRLLACCDGDQPADQCPILIQLHSNDRGNHDTKSGSVHRRVRRLR
jgi:MerR family transcriptional regulator, copper efflux regulator